MGAAVILVAMGLGLAACVTDPGQAAARQAVQQLAEEIGDTLTPPVLRVRTAEWLVVNEVATRSSPDRGVLVEPLSWEGTTGAADGGGGARLTVRITVDLPEQRPSALFGASSPAASATRCYRYGVIGYRYTDTLRVEEISCTEDAAPPLPVPETVPALPTDAETVLRDVLAQASRGSLADDVAAAFPEQGITTETEVFGDELVAAVGVPAERECLLMARYADGVVERRSFDPVWLEPGESGCSTRLYTAPPV